LRETRPYEKNEVMQMYKNILVPTDGSALSRSAIAAAVKLAKSTGAKVTAFYAAPPATPLVYENLLPVGYVTPGEHAAVIKKAAARYLGVAEKAAKAAGVKCKLVHVTSDFPAEAILATAKKEKCDLIFISSHSRRGIARMLLGSETQKVIASAKIPVIVHR
jgi:nucleotide-binding universal stress UspA family protein